MVALATGAGLAVAAQQKAGELGRFETGTEFTGAPQEVQSSGKAFRSAGLAMLVTWGAFAVTSLILFVAEPRSRPSTEAASAPAARRRPGWSVGPWIGGASGYGGAASVDF